MKKRRPSQRQSPSNQGTPTPQDVVVESTSAVNKGKAPAKKNEPVAASNVPKTVPMPSNRVSPPQTNRTHRASLQELTKEKKARRTTILGLASQCTPARKTGSEPTSINEHLTLRL